MTTDFLEPKVAKISKPVHRVHYCHLDGECTRYSKCLQTHLNTKAMTKLGEDFEEYVRSRKSCFVKPNEDSRNIKAINQSHYVSSSKHSTHTRGQE